MKILVTCPPMLASKEEFVSVLEEYGVTAFCPNVVQTLSEDELVELVPNYDGWIIGDDPATHKVFNAGKDGLLKAAVKWGIGVDNVDFKACSELNIPISNTPNMFGAEVADLAIGYLIGLARKTFYIDREIRKGKWPKPQGISLAGKKVGLIGFGDIGRHTSKRLAALEMETIVYDPGVKSVDDNTLTLSHWPQLVDECDFLIFTCALNEYNKHMLNADVINKCKPGLKIINVARGPLINESDLVSGLKDGIVHSVALDVFEKEPVNCNSYIAMHDYSILGSHNASNTVDAVRRTNLLAIEKLMHYLGVNKR